MDIEHIIRRDFDLGSQSMVRNEINTILDQEWGVGPEQLARAILQLSRGSVRIFNDLIHIIDPRDIIMLAQGEPPELRKKYE
jgi:hypothetical protein